MSRRARGLTVGTRRVVGVIAVASAVWGGTVSAQAAPHPERMPADTAVAQVDRTSGATDAVTTGARRWTATTPLYREVVRRGDQDVSPRRIEHVRELQYRLRFVGVYNGPVTGTVGDRTYAAVRRYQRRESLRVSGVAGHATWAQLLTDSMRGRSRIPGACRHGDGFHACYDRKLHQVTLWRDGSLHNSWLVRGGTRRLETRVGDTTVYYRDKEHVSSIYGTPMPYSQFFDGGEAFHGSTLMTDPFSGHSHGCINMYIEDARQLWLLTAQERLAVHVYGSWD